MAAAMPGEDSPLPGNTSRTDRNGLGGLVHCFICGSGVTPGKELRLHVKYQKEKGPFFPFLQNQEPAPGACEVSPDGHALVCAVCHCFLAEQWNSFERSRTPIEKRMYWLKRPYQCDSRRVPQEWNISYDLERRISVSSQNYEAGAESDFSSFSENENMSDQEMDLVDRAAVGKDKCFRASGKTPRDSSRKNNNVISVKNSPDSQRAIRYPVGVYGAQGSPKAESVLPARRGAKIMNNVCQSSESLAKSQERFPQRCYDSPLSDTPVQDNGIIMRNRRWLEEGNVRHAEPRQIQRVADSSCASARHPSLLYRGRGEEHSNAAAALSPVGTTAVTTKRDIVLPRENNPLRNSDNSDEDEINITSDDDRDIYDSKTGPAAQLRMARDLSSRNSVQHHHSSGSAIADASPEECVCYICGSGLRHDGSFTVSVQKQERAQSEPFFPFLWLHSPPQAAVPITSAGTTLVCGSCHTSLMQQWQGFQLADVPVLQRLYVVPLNQATSALHPPRLTPQEGRPPDPLECIPEPKASHEACFLCGQECGRDMRVAYAQAGVGKSRGAMYFPFINMLPCPPNAQGVRNGRVHCCPPCHGILEEIWGSYRLSLSEDLITSVSSFLVRYHAAMAIGGSGPAHSQTGVASGAGGSVSVCYLCGAELGAGGEFQLHVNPPGRCGEREPFFPFLTVHPPAPRAKPVDATGLVSACALCYHDLHAQWAQHESQGAIPSTPSTSSSSSANLQPASSPWARQYSCEAFVCFFCRQERRRQGGLCAVTVARLPVFLYAPRSRRTLLVDDGRRLVIGSCVECKAVVQVGQSMQQDRERDRDGHGAADRERKETESTPPRSRHK
uniref:genetic suppressor element 1 n=1 Tax=Centroberyx gerrardi TaxID=166262 RepID=UPI003AAC0E80